MNTEFVYNEDKHFKICKDYIDYIIKIEQTDTLRYDTLSYRWVEDNNIIFDSKYYLGCGEYDYNIYEIPINFVQMSEEERSKYIFNNIIKYKEKCIKDQESHLKFVILITNDKIKEMKADLQRYKENYNAN